MTAPWTVQMLTAALAKGETTAEAVAEFRQGYDFSFIPTVPLRWLAIVISAASALRQMMRLGY